MPLPNFKLATLKSLFERSEDAEKKSTPPKTRFYEEIRVVKSISSSRVARQGWRILNGKIFHEAVYRPVEVNVFLFLFFFSRIFFLSYE